MKTVIKDRQSGMPLLRCELPEGFVSQADEFCTVSGKPGHSC